MSDFSVVLVWKEVEAGLLFSNISFGDARYKEVDLKYNPLMNFQFHGTSLYKIIAYNFNLATNVALGVFNNHEISPGINIFEYTHRKE